MITPRPSKLLGDHEGVGIIKDILLRMSKLCFCNHIMNISTFNYKCLRTDKCLRINKWSRRHFHIRKSRLSNEALFPIYEAIRSRSIVHSFNSLPRNIQVQFHKPSSTPLCANSYLKFLEDSTFTTHSPILSKYDIVSVKYFHNSSINYEKDAKPSSQVEETVHHLKEESKDAQEILVGDKLTVKVVPRKSLGTRIKEEILHYYHGFKLLFIDCKICGKYVWRILNGEVLSRREHRQLVRTTSDLFRLVPFSVFIIVPFMEFLLPVALKLFPGMLPSTFETTNEKEAKMKKTFKVKLEMAKFLQQTLDNMSVEGKGHRSTKAKEFVEFFYEIQKTGKNVSNRDIMKFSKLFEDELTLDVLTRPQLVALCRLLEMQPLGTNNFLRFQLRMKLRSLAADDKIIRKEGVDSLAVWELQLACRARGMRAYGLAKETLRNQLQQWLDLNLNEKVPPSLLLLSRTLFLPDTLPPEQTLAATISTLPEEVATRTKAKIGKREGKIDNQTRFEIIKSEEKKIEEDKKEKAMELEEKRKKEETTKKKIIEEDVELLVDKAAVLVDKSVEIESESVDPKADKGQQLTAEDIDHVEEALEIIELEKKSAFMEEKELLELKSEMKDYEEDVDDFKVAILEAGMEAKLKESKAARRLFSSVKGMINRIDPMLEALKDQEKTLRERVTGLDSTYSQTQTDLIKLEDLADKMTSLTSTSDAHKVEKILSVLSKMDDDLDGALKAEHVLRVLKLLSGDSEGMSTRLFEEVVEMMVKEDQLSAQSIVEKTLSLPSFSLDSLDVDDRNSSSTSTATGSTQPQKNEPPLKEVEKIIGLKGGVDPLKKSPEVREDGR